MKEKQWRTFRRCGRSSLSGRCRCGRFFFFLLYLSAKMYHGRPVVAFALQLGGFQTWATILTTFRLLFRNFSNQSPRKQRNKMHSNGVNAWGNRLAVPPDDYENPHNSRTSRLADRFKPVAYTQTLPGANPHCIPADSLSKNGLGGGGVGGKPLPLIYHFERTSTST